MVNFTVLFQKYFVYTFSPIGFAIGWYLDKKQDEKLTAFRNKSALYKRELKPGETVTWK